MLDELAQKAIEYALDGNWKEAVNINLQIIKKNPENTDALNRLARAYSELGKFSLAKKYSKKVLAIDPTNSIARKCLDKWSRLKSGEVYKSSPTTPDIFLEEPGKTKVISLIHLGDPKILAKLDSGDEVKLSTHSHKVSVITIDGKYIGRLPDDISARIKRFVSLGNEYQVFIKSIEKNEAKVFIKEVKRSKKCKNSPSFPTEKINYIPFTPPELVHRKEELPIEEITEE